MALISFCGLLTLQVGAAILAAVFFTLAGVILSANVFDYHNPWGNEGWFPFSLLFALVFVLGLIIAGAFMFGSSYTESRSMAIISLILIAVLFCYWIILSCFSFLSNPDHTNGICISTRCPESFWIANLGYRRQHVPPEDWPENQTERPPPETTPSERRRKRWMESTTEVEDRVFERGIEKEYYNQPTKYSLDEQGNTKLYTTATEIYYEQIQDVRGDYRNEKENEIALIYQNKNNVYVNQNSGYRQIRQNDETDSPKEQDTSDEPPPKNGQKGDDEEEPSRYIFGLPFIGAIIIFIINFCFLIFSALVMYSWAQELDWADYYYDDDPVVIVEDY